MPVDQNVTITIKILEMKLFTTTAGKELVKQDCIIGDDTGQSVIVLWGKDIDRFNEGNSYKGIGIRCYQGNKHFASSAEVGIVSIDDIGMIPYAKDDEHHANIIEGDIIGVLSSEEYLSCLNCKDSVSHINETISKCNACDSMVKISECASYQTSRVIFQANNSTK